MLFGKYASQMSEAKFPSLWSGLELSLMPKIQPPSGLTAYDFGRRNRHATATNTTLSTFWTRDGLLFDGTDDFLSFPEITLGASSPWSIAFRLKLTSFHTTYPGLFGFRTSDGNGFIAFLSSSDAVYRPISFGNAASTFVRLRSSTDFSASIIGSPSFFVITYNGRGATTDTNFTLSLNGVPVALVASGAFSPHGNVNRWGQGGTNTVYVRGAMSDMSVHYRVLTAAEQQRMAKTPNAIHAAKSRSVFGASGNRRRRLLVGAQC